MNFNSKVYISLIALVIALICPLGVQAGNFWGDTVDYDIQESTFEETTPVNSASVSSTSEKRIIKAIEISGNNVIDTSTILQNMTLQSGDTYNREVIQQDLRTIYQMGYFTEKMKAIPVNNPDGTITIKIVLQENAPVTDFTIEGNTVVSTDEILSYLMPMKGRPQNIGELNEAIAKIQDCYSSKGYILARIDSFNSPIF